MNGKMTVAQHEYMANDYLRHADEYSKIGMTEFQFAACRLAELHFDARDEMKKDNSTRSYHIGFAKHGKTLIIHAVKNIDFLDCEIYDYLGEREISKAVLHERRYQIL